MAQITALDPNVIRKQAIITAKVIIATRPCFNFRKVVTGTFFITSCLIFRCQCLTSGYFMKKKIFFKVELVIIQFVHLDIISKRKQMIPINQ